MSDSKLEQKSIQTDRLNFLSHPGLTLKDIVSGKGEELRGPARRKILREAMKMIGDKSLSSNSHNEKKINILMFLILNGFAFLVRDFLLDNPDIDLKFRSVAYGITALHWATITGNYLVARNLIEHIRIKEPALLNDQTNGDETSPLMTAASLRGHVDIIQLLLEAGANSQTANIYGFTALDLARYKSKAGTFLKEFQSLSTKNSSIPASDSKEASKIKLLTPQQSFLKFGATNPGSTLEDQQKWQAEQEALCRQKIIAEELIAAIKDDNHGVLKKIFDAARKATLTADTQALKEIESILNYADNKGKTAWDYAVQEDHAEAMILLIQYGADVNKSDEKGDTALHWAARDNNAEAIETLFSPIIQTQLKLKGIHLDIEKRNHNGNTALAETAKSGNLEATIALLAAGANCQTQNLSNETPLFIAKQQSYDDTLTEKRRSVAKCIHEFETEQAVEIQMVAAEIGWFFAEKWPEIDGPLRADTIKHFGETPSLFVDRLQEMDERIPARITAGCLDPQSVSVPTSFLNKVNEERSKKLLALLRPTALGETIESIDKYGNDRWDNIREVKKRIDRGIDPNFKDERGGNVLIFLILNGYLSLVRQVLQAAPNLITSKTPLGNVLHWAAIRGNPAIMRTLLETLRSTKQLASFINAKNNLGTPLMVAIEGGHFEAAKLLIAAGADFKMYLLQSSSPTSTLEPVKDQEGLNQLIALWTSLNEVDDAPQKRALIHGMFTDIIPDHAKHLFQEKESRQRFEQQCQERNSQELAQALKDGDKEEVARLITPPKPVAKDKEVKETKETKKVTPSAPSAPWFGFDPHYRDHTGLTLLHLAAIAGNDNLVFNLVTKHKVNINAKDQNGNTALHLAALHNRRAVIETLLTEGADLTITNDKDKTPFILANEAGQIRAAHCIEHFKKPKKREEDLSVAEKRVLGRINAKLDIVTSAPSLLEAAEAGDEKVVRDILSTDESALEELDDNDYTSLHLAAKNGYAKVVNTLLEHKANIEAKGADGRTPLACAVAAGHLDTTQKLIRRGANIDVRDTKDKTLAELAIGPVKKFYEDVTKMTLLRSRYLADQLALTEDSRFAHHAELKNDQFTSLILKKLASANESKKSKAIAGLIEDLKKERPKSIKETLARLYEFSAAFGEKDNVAAKMVEGIAASRTEKPEPEKSFFSGVTAIFKGAPATLSKGESVAELPKLQIIVDTTGNSIN